MRKYALLALWAGDFERARAEYDALSTLALDKGDPVEARLLYVPELLCELSLSIERGERDLPRRVTELTNEKETRARDLHQTTTPQDAATRERLQAALRAGATTTKRALKRLRLLRSLKPEDTSKPVRLESEGRFVSVFSHPAGVEARSYYRGDLTVNLEATGDRLKQRGHIVRSRTDRMLEVEILREVMEVFIDARIRCISESQDPDRIGHMVQEIGTCIVVV